MTKSVKKKNLYKPSQIIIIYLLQIIKNIQFLLDEWAAGAWPLGQPQPVNHIMWRE